jgi:predicted aspartyl protease
MGMFKVKARVTNPVDPKKFFEEEFWVDTGALHSFIPEDKLYAIGIEPLYTREFILADGRRDRRILGSASFTLPERNETLPCLVIFGPKDSLCLLGSTTLENFGVEVDPSNRRLKPVLGIIA